MDVPEGKRLFTTIVSQKQFATVNVWAADDAEAKAEAIRYSNHLLAAGRLVFDGAGEPEVEDVFFEDGEIEFQGFQPQLHRKVERLMASHSTPFDTREVDGVTVDLIHTRFTRPLGDAFDVYVNGVCLTDESLDDVPTDDEIRDVIANAGGIEAINRQAEENPVTDPNAILAAMRAAQTEADRLDEKADRLCEEANDTGSENDEFEVRGNADGYHREASRQARLLDEHLAEGGPPPSLWKPQEPTLRPWVQSLIDPLDVTFSFLGLLGAAPYGDEVWACDGDCSCTFRISDDLYLDRYSYVNEDGWCQGQDCPCHTLPRQRPEESQ